MSKGRTPQFREEQVIKALTESRGLIAPAAEALHCNRSTVRRYMERYPEVKEAQEEAVQASVDLAQSKLMVLIEREDWRAIRYMLSTLGKDRGFTERQEIVAVGDEAESLRLQFLAEARMIYGGQEGEDEE